MEEEQSKKITTIEEASKTKDDKPSRMRMPNSLTRLWMSRKLCMTLVAFALNWLAYWREVKYLYSFTMPEQIVAFSGLTRDFHLGVALALSVYLGVQGAIEWRHGTTTTISQAASFIREQKEQKTITVNENVPNKNLREFQD